MKSCFCNETGIFESGRLSKILEWTDKDSIYSVVPQDKIYDGENDYIRFNSQSLDSSAIQKMQQCKIKLKDLFLVNQGVVSGCDYISNRNISDLDLTKDIVNGDGIFVLDLLNSRDAEQFEDTAKRFGKGEKFEERKYYHFKLSCDRKDKVSPQEAHIYAEELTAILFRDCECVIATHTDTDTVHSHIVVNAVHPVTGKKLRITRKDYTDMKDEAIVWIFLTIREWYFLRLLP